MAAPENHCYRVKVPVVDYVTEYTAEFRVYAVSPYHALAKAILKIRGADDFGDAIEVEEIK